MRSRRAALLILLFILPFSLRVEAGDGPGRCTLQVAAFPDAASARELAKKIEREGHSAVLRTVELPGKGTWTRVFVGPFMTAADARRAGQQLVANRLIDEFIVRPATKANPRDGLKAVHGNLIRGAPVAAPRGNPLSSASEAASPAACETAEGDGRKGTFARSPAGPPRASSIGLAGPTKDLPSSAIRALELARVQPSASGLVPLRNPVRTAFDFFAAAGRVDGGLWIAGDLDEGRERLRWIVGPRDAGSIRVLADGRVELDQASLARAAGVADVGPGAAPLAVAGYVAANEGLLLLTQLVNGAHCYLLHVGRSAPTQGGDIELTGSVNLDKNFDSRINPNRRSGKKLKSELPPDGFDSLVAINPDARWFNLDTSRMIPVGHITFHELAEAHAKLEMGLDYLGRSSKPGAHDIALEREVELKSQRPRADVVVTLGTNRVLVSGEDLKTLSSDRPTRRR
ncbi:MAG TPA: SPOR domain-containing protein [Blastocatellia bacterium]|nr:SPOR domain-containing protein [Blastocatellia bacterium]